MQQQHEKIRQKRDGSYSTLPGYSPYDIIRQATGFGGLPTLHVMNSPETAYRNGLTRAPRIQYRDAGPHNIFPDPLFKEQWYLVSKVCVRKKFLFYSMFVRSFLGEVQKTTGSNLFPIRTM